MMAHHLGITKEIAHIGRWQLCDILFLLAKNTSICYYFFIKNKGCFVDYILCMFVIFMKVISVELIY